MHSYENNDPLKMHGELTDQKSFGGVEQNHVMGMWLSARAILPHYLPQLNVARTCSLC